jgi:uncharacterized protein YraI
MTLVSRLTLPALIGGLIALAAAGLFSPQVHALGVYKDTIAQVTNVPVESLLVMRDGPDTGAGRIGTVAPNAFVWVDSCIGADSDREWCLVERSGTKGWVSAQYLTTRWN